MAQENSSSTLEMGTSDQVLVATKRKKSLTYIIGGIAMLAAIGIVIALVVTLSGNEGGTAEPIEQPSTITPTSPITTTTTTTSTTTPSPTTLPAETEAPPSGELDAIELEDIINGVFTSAAFNGSWASGNEVIYRNGYGDLVRYDIDANSTTLLVPNSSLILQQSSRFMQLSADESQILLAYSVIPVYRYSYLARYAAIDLTTGNSTELRPTSSDSVALLQNVVWGPSGTSLAFVYLNNIYYQANLTSEPEQITDTGKLNVIYNGIPDWVYEEEVFVSNNAMWFSADGSKLAYVTFDDNNVSVMRVPHYGVPGSTEYQYTRHHDIRYPKPGTNNPVVTVTLRDLNTGNDTIYIAPTTLNEPIIKAVRFVNNESIAVAWTNRGQTSLIVLICNQGSTACSQIFEYSEGDGWIDNIPFFFNQQGDAFITILPQAVEGERYKQIVQISEGSGSSWTLTPRTNTKHTVSEILLWTPEDVVWYKATSPSDATEQHIYTVSPTNVVSCFSCGVQKENGDDCLYNDASVSPNADKVALNCAGPNVPQVMILNSTGGLIETWDSNSETQSLLSTRSLPEIRRFSVPLGEGLGHASVQIQLPSGYQNRTDVPLLVYVYGGPDTALVTKQWNIDWGTSLVSRWGIAVAVIDGRGSGLRGVDNMFAVNRRLGTVEIEDQINVTRYLQENLSYIDANRTCIWGWSYGGYASSAALARGGDAFRCAIAVAPVVDWRFYDTIYTERYMDTPAQNPTAYLQSSLLTPQVVEAYRNKSYFLIHGTADDNVHYQHAMLFSRLLQTEDVYFTQMSYTDEDHGLVGVRPHLYHALEKFLEENML